MAKKGEKKERPKFSTGVEMSDYHVARREGGIAGLFAHRIKRLAERAEEILFQMADWKNTEGHKEVIEKANAQLKAAATALEEAQGELTKLPKGWSPKLGRGGGRTIPTDALVMFKDTTEATSLREALGLKEKETGRIKEELKGKMVLVQFGERPAFPAFSRCFVEVTDNGESPKDEEKKEEKKKGKKEAESVKQANGLETMGRDALRSRAKELKIPGIGKMNAEQLRAAISASMNARS